MITITLPLWFLWVVTIYLFIEGALSLARLMLSWFQYKKNKRYIRATGDILSDIDALTQRLRERK